VGAILTVTGATGSFANSALTYSNGILSVGNPSVGSAVAGSINVANGFYSNGTLFSGGGGGGASITNAAQGRILTATGASSSVIWAESSMVYSNSILSLTGGFQLTNGYRPSYTAVTSGTSITPGGLTYGTYYDIQTSTITGLSIGYPVTGSNNWSNDANAYWVFRNNTGGYLSLTVTYTSATPNIYPSTIVIPPANSITLMATYPGGGTNSNYVLF